MMGYKSFLDPSMQHDREITEDQLHSDLLKAVVMVTVTSDPSLNSTNPG